MAVDFNRIWKSIAAGNNFLSFFNGSVVLGFLFGHAYRRLPGRTGAMKGIIFGLVVWIVMGLIFFPMLGKGLFAMQTQLGILPGYLRF